MMGKSVNELAQALSENERRDLTERIKKSLSLSKTDTSSIIRTQNSPDHRKHHIEEGLAKLGFIQKFVLQIKRIFTNKTEAELFLESKKLEIARTIDGSHVTDTQTGSISPEFANDIYKLFVASSPVRRFLSIMWNNEVGLKEAVQYILEQKIPKAKSTLYQFLTIDEIQILFEHAESKAGIRQELLGRVNTYLDSIPHEVFTDLENQLMPLYYLKPLCDFDFITFFKTFYVDLDSIEKGNPNFKSCQYKKVLPQIEDLYFYMFTARKAGNMDLLPPQLYKYVQDKRVQKDDKELKTSSNIKEVFGDAPIVNAPEDPKIAQAGYDEGLKTIKRDLQYLIETLQKIVDHSKIADIIRYFNDDPYFRFLGYTPSLNLREFYVASLRMDLLQVLDKDFGKMRKIIIDNLLKTMFSGGVFEFEYFKKFPYGTIRNNLPGFRYVNSLAYLNNIMMKLFVKSWREIFHNIVKSLPNRNKDIGNEILFNTTALENLGEKIKSLDASFNPDHDNAKSYMRLKVSLEKDINADKQYRQYVAQKDKENRDFLEEAIEHLKVLANSIEEVAGIPSALLTERFNIAIAPGSNINDYLRSLSIKLRNCNKLIRYQRALDDEGFDEKN